VFVAVVKEPGLWTTAVRQMKRTARPHWWKHRPFLPVPSGEYLSFRLVTQYGGAPNAGGRWEADDVVRYLRWCKSWDTQR